MAKAKFRMVHTSFWNDPYVSEEMTAEDKYFFLYLLTNEHTTQIGIYGITKKQMAFELGYSIESINALMQRFISHHDMIRYNEQTRELAVKNWGKYNLNKGGKPVIDCVNSELKQVKDLTLIKYVSGKIENAVIKGIYDSYHDSLTTRGQKEEKEEEKEEEEKEEQQQEKESSAPPSSVVVVENQKSNVNPFTFYQENGFGLTMNGITQQKIMSWCDDLSDELVIYAMQKAIESNRVSWSYAEGILKNWASKRVKTIQDVNALEAQFIAQQQAKQQRSYGKPQKVEPVPEWLEQQKRERQVQQPSEQTQQVIDFEAERQALLARIKKS